MSIKKVTLKSGETRYRVTVNAGVVNGKRKNIVRSAKGYKKAQMLEAELRASLVRGDFDEDGAPKNITFNELFQQWWPIYVQTVEGSTAYKTKQLFTNHLLPMFGGKYLSAIKTSRIQYAVTNWSQNTTKAYKQRYIYLKKIPRFRIKLATIASNLRR